MNDLYIEHHGILGQKWGIRRFQDENGNYTPSGRRRYDVGPAEEATKKKQAGSDDYLEAKALRKKGINNLSNDELRKLNERSELEAKYKSYQNSGESYVKKALIESGTKLAVNVATAGALYLGAKYLAKKYNINAETITKGVINTAATVSKTVASETAKGGASIAKAGLKEIGKVGHNVRKSVASTPQARAYVKTMRKVFGWK